MKILFLMLVAIAILRATPAIPLIVKDPYLNVWQMSDELSSDWARHWSGGIKAIAGMIRIDEKPYKFMGLVGQYTDIPTLPQKEVEIRPTRTIVSFENESIRLELTFLTPTLPNDYKILSLPISYIIASVKSLDKNPHNIQLYFDISAEWAGGDQNKKVVWEKRNIRTQKGELVVYKIQLANSNILQEVNDYADWGFPIWCTGEATNWEAGPDGELRPKFLRGEKLGNRIDLHQPRAINDNWPVFAFQFDLGKVGSQSQTIKLVIGHIREISIGFANEVYLPIWKSYFENWEDMLSFAWDEFPSIASALSKFDSQLQERAVKVGGEDYATLLSLAYRQVLGACELVYNESGKFMFMKEISSGSFIQTVDVIFPASPFFLAFNPELLRMQLEPIFKVSESQEWKEPFAPHDLGRYPVALLQSYGAPMPIEESGNMLLMSSAYARFSGDTSLLREHFDTLKKWADYLVEKGIEPEEQLCTDDFTGPSALNVNLAAKAIAGVQAFSQICHKLGKAEDAHNYAEKAKKMLDFWLKSSDAGTHLSRVYGKPETWSLKYNIFYARLAGADIFPKDIINREIDFYLTKLNKFGVPLDERFTYTKADWLSWVAFMSDDKSKREKLLQSLVRFVKETPNKVPFTDWYDTQTGKVVGFAARPVLGALFALLLQP